MVTYEEYAPTVPISIRCKPRSKMRFYAERGLWFCMAMMVTYDKYAPTVPISIHCKFNSKRDFKQKVFCRKTIRKKALYLSFEYEAYRY